MRRITVLAGICSGYGDASHIIGRFADCLEGRVAGCQRFGYGNWDTLDVSGFDLTVSPNPVTMKRPGGALMHVGLVESFTAELLRVDRVAARRLLEAGLAESSSVRIVEEVVAGALERIGADWERGEASLAQVYMAGRICEGMIDEILPPGQTRTRRQPRSAVTVFADYHVLGKRVVYAVVRAAGYEIDDYGRTEVAGLVERVLAERPPVLFVSVLMLPSALRLREVCAALRAAGAPTRVMVGGAPFRFDANLWKEVGAGAMGRTASDALLFLEGLSQATS